ncbi:hypothetical protein WHR41_09552 [Cladosporium halotolerans]|uniref:HMA domain-containing protein n=1 Tax=Cladosporium halotolerans TaxID=1052096 RepID=A0AB34KER5_9PEZI
MPCKPSFSRKKKHCDEECLTRIAARLCSLDNATRETDGLGKAGGCEEACCGGEKEEDGENGGSGERVKTVEDGDSGSASTKTGKQIGRCGDVDKIRGGCCSEVEPVVAENAKTTGSGCCGPTPKESEGCCGDGRDGQEICSSGEDAERSSGCCDFSPGKKNKGDCCGGEKDANVVASTSGCSLSATQDDECYSEKVVDDCRSSEKATLTSPTSYNSTTRESCCSSTLPKKTGNTANEKSCGEKIKSGDCRSKSLEVRVQPLEDCGDSCCRDTPQNAPCSPLSACIDNFQTTMDRLDAMLKRGQCLCRRVQEQWGFNCCDPASIPAEVVTRKKNASTAASMTETLSKEKFAAVSTASAIHPRCSFDAPSSVKNRKQEAAVETRNQPVDVEQDSAREHVVLDVTGMTCTGCSKKMMNVLGGISGLSNAQVTFVSGNAEFDLDSGVAGKVEDVLQRVEKETGFKCSRLVSGFQELHVLMSATAAREIAHCLPAGVMSIVKDKKKKDNYYITYNPRVVGARVVLPPTAQLSPPQDSAGIAEGKKSLLSNALSTALAATLTIPVVVLEWSDNHLPSSTVELVALILGTGVQLIAVPEFYIGATKSLIYSRVIEMDMLVVISISAAYGYSVVAYGLQRAGFDLEQGPFFETSTLLITLVLLGRLMAAWARMKALSIVSLRSLQAETALLLGSSGDSSKIDARLLQFGDSIVIQPHSRIVTDGTVIDGASDVDESMVTGESLPVAKQTGNNLIAGTINGSGTLRVQLTRLPGDNSISDIATLVENAVAAKPRVQDLADRVASYFIPVVVTIAVIVFCIWIAVAIEIRNRNGGGAVGLAITYAIAVLAISCPCALGLAVPMVLVIAGGVAARAGVVIKAADAIERSYKMTDVVFDKTGTLTEGDLQVVHTQTLPSETLSEESIMSLGKAMVEGNEHPVSVAVAEHLKGKAMGGASKIRLENITSIPGAGIEAQHHGSLLKAGNPYWLKLEDHSKVAGLLQQAMTLLCVTLNNDPILVVGLKSTLRSNAAAIIADLHRRKITTHIVSGDNPAAVLDIAKTLGVEESNIRSRASPSEKQEYVHTLQTCTPESKRTILFIGDGTNDAVAIAQADIGVQMGSASDVTGAVSDVVILSKDLGGLITLLELSRRAVRRILFNFAWSAVYNFFAILLASGAFVKVRIGPAYAGLGEIVSVAPVILAAVSLMWGRKLSG